MIAEELDLKYYELQTNMKIEIDAKHIPVLSAALGELPYKISAPLIADINNQIFKHQEKEKYSASLDENGIEINQN